MGRNRKEQLTTKPLWLTKSRYEALETFSAREWLLFEHYIQFLESKFDEDVDDARLIWDNLVNESVESNIELMNSLVVEVDEPYCPIDVVSPRTYQPNEGLPDVYWPVDSATAFKVKNEDRYAFIRLDLLCPDATLLETVEYQILNFREQLPMPFSMTGPKSRANSVITEAHFKSWAEKNIVALYDISLYERFNPGKWLQKSTKANWLYLDWSYDPEARASRVNKAEKELAHFRRCFTALQTQVQSEVFLDRHKNTINRL